MRQILTIGATRLDAFFTRIDGDLHEILFADILYFSAKRNYCEVNMIKKSFLIHVPIKSLEEKLPQNLFVRSHRSYIIPIHKIKRLNHRYVYVEDQKLPVSAQYYMAIEKRLLVIGCEQYLKYKKERAYG